MPATVSVAVRADVVVLAAMLYGTEPLPVPLVAPVSVTQPAFEAAVHAQPVPAVTPTLPVVAPAPTDWPVELIVGAHGGAVAWYEKPFDTELPVVPPGPTAVTRASNTTFGVGAVCRRGMKLTRMTPALGAGLPRSTVSNATDDPSAKIDSE